MQFSLIIPLWNEGANIELLIAEINQSGLQNAGMAELILVNNGSTDDTGSKLKEFSSKFSWIKTIHLEENLNYGGGVYEGMRHSQCDITCYIPGDLQVLPDDVQKVWEQFQELAKQNKNKLFVKGYRTIRHDPYQTRFVSKVYTVLANLILGLHVKDVNGLPKMFHKSLMDLIPGERMVSFVFDSQILSLARTHNWQIEEVPVTFHGRRIGVSSWSKKKIYVYYSTFKQILRLRYLRYQPGVLLTKSDD